MKLNLPSYATILLLFAASFAASDAERDITYNGGPVVTGSVNVYFVFYGNWTKDDSEATYNILMDFTDNIGQSDWFSTLKYYTDSHGQGVNGPLKTAAGLIDAFSQHQDPANTTELDFSLNGSEAHIKIIKDATQNTNHLGGSVDSHGIYLVLTSSEVSMDGFCTEWCGYNSWTDEFLFAVIGHPSRCPDVCLPPLNKEVSPNGNVYADAMVNTLAHEYIDILTDPIGNAYRVAGSTTEELADFCMPPIATTDEWWGQVNKSPSNNAYYNIELGDKKYLIQSIWHPTEKKCVLSGKE